MTARTRRPGAGHPKGTKHPRGMIASFRGSGPFKGWFNGLVSHCRKRSGWPDLPASSVIERALLCSAREQEYEAAAPTR
jgi:hypothetical protein